MPGKALPRSKQVFLTGFVCARVCRHHRRQFAEIRRETGKRRLKAARRGAGRRKLIAALVVLAATALMML